MKIEPEHIKELLRQRREILPPEDYFEDFLFEFQRRQRAEMLRRPSWLNIWDRANLWLDGFRVPAVAYAAILIAGIGATGLLLQRPDGGTEMASSNKASAPFKAPSFSISSPGATVPVAQVSTNLPPSYVLENRPISNDRPFSF